MSYHVIFQVQPSDSGYQDYRDTAARLGRSLMPSDSAGGLILSEAA